MTADEIKRHLNDALQLTEATDSEVALPLIVAVYAAIDTVVSERDAALKLVEMNATSGAFHAATARNVTAERDALKEVNTANMETCSGIIKGLTAEAVRYRFLVSKANYEGWSEDYWNGRGHQIVFQSEIKDIDAAIDAAVAARVKTS